MRKFARVFDSFLLRGLLAYALLAVVGYALSHAEPPAWLSPVLPPPSPLPAVVGTNVPTGGAGGGVQARVVTKVVERVRRDTITLVRTDTVVRVDTLRPPRPVYWNYTIYYEAVDRKLSLRKDFLWDFSKTAQRTQLQSSDTTLLSLGSESLRVDSYTYDGNGNKTQTYEKIIEGLDMRVSGANVNITYRVEKSLLSLNGRFDGFGLLQLSSDFSRRRYFLGFIPLDFLFGAERYTLFLRVEKMGVSND